MAAISWMEKFGTRCLMSEDNSVGTAEAIFRDNKKRKAEVLQRDHAGAASFRKKKRCPTCGNTGMVTDPETGLRRSCPNKHHRKGA